MGEHGATFLFGVLLFVYTGASAIVGNKSPRSIGCRKLLAKDKRRRLLAILSVMSMTRCRRRLSAKSVSSSGILCLKREIYPAKPRRRQRLPSARGSREPKAGDSVPERPFINLLASFFFGIAMVISVSVGVNCRANYFANDKQLAGCPPPRNAVPRSHCHIRHGWHRCLIGNPKHRYTHVRRTHDSTAICQSNIVGCVP